MRRALLAVLLLAAPAFADEPSRRERLSWAGDAQASFDRKDFAAAAAALEKAASPGAARADLAKWLPALGRCYENLKNYQKALAVYQRALAVRPKDAERMLDLARVYALVDLDAQAIELYKKALDRAKQRKDIVLSLAELHAKTGQWKDARREAERYVQWEPRDAAAQRLLARIEEADGDIAAAARRRQSVLAQHPSAEGFFEVGRLWTRLGEYDLADAAYKRAEELGLSAAGFHLERGVSAWRRGDDREAERFWKKALEKDAGLAPARFLLAVLDGRSGRREDALRAMERVRTESASPYIQELARDFIVALSSAPSGDRQ